MILCKARYYNKMEYEKLIVNISKEEMNLIDKACQIEKRTKASLTRKALQDFLDKILIKEVGK
jgi:hypothetical protein